MQWISLDTMCMAEENNRVSRCEIYYSSNTIEGIGEACQCISDRFFYFYGLQTT
jgi:hypothetical protein